MIIRRILLIAAILQVGCENQDSRLADPEQAAAAAFEQPGVRFDREEASLAISDTQITDAALEDLAGFTGLPELSLTSLEHLDLGCTQITDAGLKHLDGLTRLKTLTLGYTGITDAGIRDGRPRMSEERLSADARSLPTWGSRGIKCRRRSILSCR